MSLLKDKYSLLIFDWDGTLMDSTGRIVSAMQATASHLQLPVPDTQTVKSIIGLNMREVLDTVFPNTTSKTRELILEQYRFQYVEADTTPTPLFGGSKQLLDWLNEKQVATAVATGKARHGLNRVLNQVGLESFFKYSICGDEAESKPHPEMINILLEQTQRQKSEVLLVGDSIHDIRMANNAGIDSVAVTSGANEAAELSALEPRHILQRVCFLQEWLEQ